MRLLTGRRCARAAMPAMLPAVAVAVAVGCGTNGDTGSTGRSAHADTVPTVVERRLPLHAGRLHELCPAPDLPRDLYRERARAARRRLTALMHEVRGRPDAVVDRVFEDAHTGEEHTDRLTVLQLAEEHLDEPGVDGVPCARTLMTRLAHAVARARGEQPPKGPPPVDEPVFLLEEVAAGLGLRSRGAIHRNAHCREVQAILTSREEVERALAEPPRGVTIVTVPQRTVGVEVFRATHRCRSFLERRLRALADGR